ncbi:MAG: ABC transporter ATP-binding protein [Steroidobacteraceae bacterium]
MRQDVHQSRIDTPRPAKTGGSPAAGREVVRVAGLRVIALGGDGGTSAELVKEVSFSIGRGEVLALIGGSGSGKTTVALALLGHARAGCRIAAGSIEIGGVDVLALATRELLEHRGRRVAYIAQSAAAAFNPSRRIMDQVIETSVTRGHLSHAAAREKAVSLYRSLALPDPERIGERYPHQLSGGQLQRLLAAMALMSDPELVILDEPTTALDVTTQIEVLRAFKRVIAERGTTALYVSHDLAVIAQLADRIVVLSAGEVRESGTTAQILGAPADPYTMSLFAAAGGQASARSSQPRQATAAGGEADSGATWRAPARRPPLLAIEGLTAGYGQSDRRGLPLTVALDDVTLTVAAGAALGVIGESGSGKSTLARVLAGIVPPASGAVLLDGKPLPARMAQRSREKLRRIQIVFQHADTALNPAHTVAHILGRPLELYFGLRGAAREARIARLLDRVQLEPHIAARRPPELSGGQKQRINLARALAAEPDIILCDEVTSALDAVVGAAILELMAELRRELGLAYVLISHDVTAVRAICDDVAVLYAGQVVESGTVGCLADPQSHPYTRLLVSCVPEMRSGWLENTAPASPPAAMTGSTQSPQLCRFLQRCPARIADVCDLQPPPRVRLADGREVLCHLPASRS